ncbi:MAG TPA: PilT/PilU family type 4a pilus ATPase [Wenzhouxiangellaceae bacterium]|nr:PilT/PilU family type 4a pilus ATPase [Wenzhouxiangellaceae bacterium]
MSVIDSWLKMLHDESGSDLFVTVGAPPCIKVNGRIKPVNREPLSKESATSIVLGTMSEEQAEQFKAERELQYAISIEGFARFRMSAFYQRGSIGVVCRRIETKIPTFEELALPEGLGDLSMSKRGIIVMVGATGTGKSTTLAAMVGHRNENSTGHIISIEDPIEYVHRHRRCIITQREVGIDTESFEMALRNTLRQAPDVIMIGEVRTREAMEHAITFAETGHLCLTTLHANNANQAMDRILHFFPEERHNQVLLDLSFNLKAVVAQQLVPSIDGSRRHVALEVLLSSPLVQEKIRKGKIDELKQIMKDSVHHGMIIFDQSLLKLYQEGKISYEEAVRHADSANEVRLAVKLSEGGDAESLSRSLRDVDLLDNQ